MVGPDRRSGRYSSARSANAPYQFFPLWKRGMKGDFMAFQKAKLLPFFRKLLTPIVEPVVFFYWVW
jgi:hypothetical protein